jgi:hypothetical protein
LNLHSSIDDLEVGGQLDQLLARMRRLGFTDDVTLEAIFAWAAERAYDAGGYPAARTLMLDALETILMREACRDSVK